MLTPLDIQNKEFKKELRGYSVAEVDEFMGTIIESYEKLYKENIDARDKIEVLTNAVGQYKKMESTLQNALITAQSAGDEVITNAKAKGERIMSEAQMKVAEITAEGQQRINQLVQQYGEVKQSLEAFKSKALQLIQTQAENLNDLQTEDDNFLNIISDIPLTSEPEADSEENEEEDSGAYEDAES